MHVRRLIVIGTSAGGIEALRELVGALPPELPAAIAVVMHVARESPGVLHEILDRSGPLQAVHATNGERLRPGVIYVAPPDHHLLVEPGRIRVTRGPKENRFRPAIDPLFRSAAQVFGPAAIGVILTGSLDDGTSGLGAIKKLGGIAVVQDPADALFPSMPQNALKYVEADHVVPLSGIPPLLARLTALDIDQTQVTDVPGAMQVELKIASEEDPLMAGINDIGTPSRIGCPECHGVLMQMKQREGPLRFRCHTGHAYSAASLLAEVELAVETQLGTAMRAMQEGSMLMRQLADHSGPTHAPGDDARLRERAEALERQADVLRQLVTAEHAGTERNA